MHKLSLIKIELSTFSDSSFTLLRGFFYLPHSVCIFLSGLFDNTVLRLHGLTRWHASMSEGLRLAPRSSKMFSAVSFNELSVTVFGMLTIISRYSRREYYSILQNFRSTWTCYLVNLLRSVLLVPFQWK